MIKKADFKLIPGHNFRILDVKGFGRVVFGCPPGIVKDLAMREEPLPDKYVIPVRTFVQGRNNFDFEFVVYSFLFLKAKTDKITFHCTADQKERFKIILNETLYGPMFHQILRSQFHSYVRKQNYTPNKTLRFFRFIDQVAADKNLFELFRYHLKNHSSDRLIHKKIGEYFSRKLQRKKWITSVNGTSPEKILAKNYILCGQLKVEMDLFQLAPEEEREKFTRKVLKFKLFDRKKTVILEGEKGNSEKLKVVQVEPAVFDVYHKDRRRIRVDISKLDSRPDPIRIESIEKPLMGVTFMGVGSGFAPQRRNSCLIAWTEGKGIMVDALHDSNSITLGHGITEGDIPYIFLTHVHSDHDIGLIEKILYGERVKVISTRIIFDSFLRKVESLTCFPQDMIESFVDFLEVEPNKKIKIPGFKSSYFTFDYSLHSIPAGRFVLTYKYDKDKTKSISHSGDTKYDPALIEGWYAQGLLSKKRKEALLGFVWDADIIIHDVGGGILHTELQALENLGNALAKKTILVHQHENPQPHPRFRYAWEGQTQVLIKDRAIGKHQRFQTLRQVPLFRKVPQKQLEEMLSHSRVAKFNPNQIVFSQDERGNDFYVILDGFAEIIIDGKTTAVYEKGKFFGELAVSTNNPHRRATVKAMSPLTVLEIPRTYYEKLSLPNIKDEFYKLRNFYNDIISPSLIASLAFGKMVHWKKNDIIIKRGARERDLFIILSGKVEVIRGIKKPAACLSCGDVIGEIALLKNVPRTATVRACSDEVYAIRFKVSEAYKLFRLFPSFFGTVYQKFKKLETLLN